MTFRFDDISGNTDLGKLGQLCDIAHHNFPKAKILCGVSMVFNDNQSESGAKQFMPFKPIYKAMSDFACFYEVEGIDTFPWLHKERGYVIDVASHGLVHLDHRHLSRDAQEMSIVLSCSLLKAKIFIPPFNWYNDDTQDICEKHDIELIKFEDGWRSLEHEPFDAEHGFWYCHPRNLTVEEFTKRLEGPQ